VTVIAMNHGLMPSRWAGMTKGAGAARDSLIGGLDV